MLYRILLHAPRWYVGCRSDSYAYYFICFLFTYLSRLWLATQGRVFTRILIAGNFEIGQVPSDLFSYTLFSDIP
jgi:hypothetical protein